MSLVRAVALGGLPADAAPGVQVALRKRAASAAYETRLWVPELKDDVWMPDGPRGQLQLYRRTDLRTSDGAVVFELDPSMPVITNSHDFAKWVWRTSAD